MKFSWLHLTDFHYGLNGQACLWPNLRQPFLDSLVALHELCGPWDVVFFTGDLVQSGEAAQFKRMQIEVLEPLWQRLAELGSGDALLLAVPGNHDLYRPKASDDDPAMDRLVEPGGFQRIAAKFWDQPAGTYRRAIANAFAAYAEWWDGAPRRPVGVIGGALPGDFAVSIERDKLRVGVVGLNTAFLQLAGGDYKGRLVWDAHQLHALCEGGVDVWTQRHDLCLLLTHQGPDWLTPEARKHGETEVAPAGRFAAHLFGHQHETSIQYIRSGGSAKATRLCQGNSVFGMEKHGDPPLVERAHGYAAGRIELIDGGAATLRLWPRIAYRDTGPWRFVPDHAHAELEADQGTAPETVTLSSRAKPAVRPPPAARPAFAAAAAFVPHSTLPSRRPFFGRTKELQRLADYLLPEDRSWGVVLDGPGGMGKTALALEAAHRAPAEHYPLKLWITAKGRELTPEGERRLADHRVESFNALLDEIGAALGREDVPRATPEDRPRLVMHALAQHKALLVLDNLESFTKQERARLFELLDKLPTNCRALVTSRRTVRSSGAHLITLDKLERDAADELFDELAKSLTQVRRLTPAERDALYAETGGNPLLLGWTASQLGRTTGRAATVAQALERLKEAHRLQQHDEKNDPLDYVFGDLVETFSEAEVTVLAALAHFSQPAPIDWLLPMTALSQKAAETALDGLRDRALLIEDDLAGTWLLPPLAARFLRRVRPEVVGASGERLANWAYATAVENGYERHERYVVLENAWPRLEAALPALLAGDNRRLQGTCEALVVFLEFSGRWDVHISFFADAEARAATADDRISAGWRAFQTGFGYFLRNQTLETLACAGRAAAHWADKPAGAFERATAERLRALGLRKAGRFDEALQALQDALDQYRQLDPTSLEVMNCIIDMGALRHSQSRHDEASRHYGDALAMAEKADRKESIAICTGNLSVVALNQQRWADAERLASEALTIAESIGRKELIACNCGRLAEAMASQGRIAEGLPLARRAVAMLTELRHSDLAWATDVLAVCQG